MTGGDSLLQLDDRDSRRELYILLSKLSPRDRYRFLVRCCQRCRSKHGPVAPDWFRMKDRLIAACRGCPQADHGFTRDVIADLCFLALTYNLNLVQVALDLEQCVRRPELLKTPLRPPPPA